MGMLHELISNWPFVLAGLLVLRLAANFFASGLSKYPAAHWLAAYTDWWRFFDVLSREPEKTHLEAHRKYGDIVRLGPRTLSFADPAALKIIYGLNKGMTKSDFYPIQSAISKGRPLQSLFSTQDEAYHARYRRCVNSAFSMSSLVEYEPSVENTIDFFIGRTKELYSKTEQTCDFSRWLQYFAFDVIGDLTWSKRLGFLERNEDVDGIMKFVGDFLMYAAPVGQMPWLDQIWWKNPLRLKLQQFGFNNSVFPVTRFAQQRSAERNTQVQKDERAATDLLSRFKQAQVDHPEFMTEQQILASCTSMVFAGSETTAISLSSVFYYLLKHEKVYTRLVEELEHAVKSGDIAPRHNHKVSWNESQRLPYLDAVIQESFRMHPAPGLLLERVVPATGTTICGQFVPGGTIVGCNAWVVHRRKEVFGDDVDTFRPERWSEALPEQLKRMKAAMFMFGAGPRTCIGKNISLLEIYKLVPTFLRNFNVEFAAGTTDWRTCNAWFVRQINFNVNLTDRSTTSG